MKNPVIVRQRTPNGGSYSEMWYFDRNGEVAKDMESAERFRINEKDDDGRIIQTTYGLLDK